MISLMITTASIDFGSIDKILTKSTRVMTCIHICVKTSLYNHRFSLNALKLSFIIVRI